MEDQITAKIFFPADGVIVEASVCREDDGSFKLLEQPLLVESASIFDLIKVEQQEDGSFKFLHLAKKSGWHTFHFVLTENATRSPDLDRLLKKVEQLHGRWERQLGGYLLISLPPQSDYDPAPDVAAI